MSPDNPIEEWEPAPLWVDLALAAFAILDGVLVWWWLT